MLSREPKPRPSASECLQHSFFCQPAEETAFAISGEEWQAYMEYSE